MQQWIVWFLKAVGPVILNTIAEAILKCYLKGECPVWLGKLKREVPPKPTSAADRPRSH